MYVGPAGIVTGSARLVQQARQRDAAQQQFEELVRRRRELRRGIAERDAQFAVLQDELAADRAELERLDLLEQRQSADAAADESAMAARRWADSDPRDG